MSEFNPADVAITGRRVVPEAFPDDDPDERLSDGPARAAREGLPSGYRMRADAHYVDELTSRRLEVPRPVATERPRDVRPPDRPSRDSASVPERPIERVHTELASELATIESAVNLLGRDGSPMARRVGLDLIRAETWRASWLLRAHAILNGHHRARLERRAIGPILAQLRDGFASECRLTGVRVELRLTDWAAMAPVDETALVAGLSAAVIWTFGQMSQAEPSVIALAAEVDADRLRTIEIARFPLPAATRTESPDDRAFARAADDWVAGLAASAAKAVASQHHAEAVFLAGDGERRSTVRFAFRGL